MPEQDGVQKKWYKSVMLTKLTLKLVVETLCADEFAL